jgi:cyanate lyase
VTTITDPVSALMSYPQFDCKEIAMIRDEVTQLILTSKRRKQLKWAQLAEAAGQGKEWTTAALMGQMPLSSEQAGKVGALLELPAEAVDMLQEVPCKGSLTAMVPTDPLIYRFYEQVSMYGDTIRELIHEEFGDGIMSAIDFSMNLTREPNPRGDRVHIVMSGKFLPYKMY